MRQSTSLLVRESLTRWIRAPGMAMLLVVALFPAIMTGAWAWTHQNDLVVGDIDFTPASPSAGDNVTISVDVDNRLGNTVGSFNVTIRVGYYEASLSGQPRWRNVHNETVAVDGLGPKGSTTVETVWEADAGSFQIEALVDMFDNDIKELEKQNNYRPGQIQVAYPVLRPEVQRPETERPDNNTTLVDAETRVTEVTVTPDQRFEGDDVTFRVRMSNDGPDEITNASLTFVVYRMSNTGSIMGTAHQDSAEGVRIAAGGTADRTFTWEQSERGLFGGFAFLDTARETDKDNETDNSAFQQFHVERKIIWDEPDPHATAKSFYHEEVLLPLHFTLLVPLIGLFYAGGVIHDERQRGDLVYLLTRPVSRTQLPLVRFASSFGIAFLAVAIGVFLTYFVLLATTTVSIGYLVWPLAFSALVLFLYAGASSFIGVVAERPYLAGLLYILGFETLVAAGRRVLINGQPLLQDWVLNFSLVHWVTKAYGAWDPEAGGDLGAISGEPAIALAVVIGLGLAGLIGSTVLIRRREFE